VEGIPEELLAQIEDLVLHNFYWLLAIMSTNPLLTYQFISTDLLGREQPLPPEESQLWVDATERLHITLEQMQECSTCIQVCCALCTTAAWGSLLGRCAGCVMEALSA
jgi:hypothetical protein